MFCINEWNESYDPVCVAISLRQLCTQITYSHSLEYYRTDFSHNGSSVNEVNKIKK